MSSKRDLFEIGCGHTSLSESLKVQSSAVKIEDADVKLTPFKVCSQNKPQIWGDKADVK